MNEDPDSVTTPQQQQQRTNPTTTTTTATNNNDYVEENHHQHIPIQQLHQQQPPRHDLFVRPPVMDPAVVLAASVVMEPDETTTTTTVTTTDIVHRSNQRNDPIDNFVSTTTTAAALTTTTPSDGAVATYDVANEPSKLLLLPLQQQERYRRLKRYCRKYHYRPSFMKLLRTDFNVSDDDDDDDDPSVPLPTLEQLPKRLKLDVNTAWIPLDRGTTTAHVVLSLVDAPPPPPPTHYHHDTTTTTSATHPPIAPDNEDTTTLLPSHHHDEGWYEGVAPWQLLPEDMEYLTPVQQYVRRATQLFSALPTTRGGTVQVERGRVGLRCRHCTAAAAATSPDRGRALPASACYYPNSILHLSSTYLSKFQAHFLNTCPYISDAAKMELLTLLEENPNSNNNNNTSKGNINPNELSVPSLSHTMYNVISARRIGLVDVTDRGMRFRRDLQSQPLPFSNVRYQVEHEMGTMVGDGGGETTPTTTVDGRMTADAAAEAVLAQVVTELDDGDNCNNNSGNNEIEHQRLCRVDDKAMLSDYIFLAMTQVSFCRATSTDLTARYKKSKWLQIGYTGFCCRWCHDPRNTNEPVESSSSARFFPSAADHLTTAIGSSLVGHLQKCRSVPARFHHALATYKRLHGRHMAQLPYGSQRRMYQIFWSRLRAADKMESETMETLPLLSGPAVSKSDEIVDEEEQTPADELPMEEMTNALDDEANDSRVIDTHTDTKSILQEAEDNWDQNTNDGLILPTDRHLVSDYVFLMMRQMKKARMDDTDVVRLRKHTKANQLGLACIHCFNRETQSQASSGRAFPSAPDNFHATLNTSLYNHMQVCVYVNVRLKQALTDTRKYHSKQCASVTFGSQRKFFNILCDRLSNDPNTLAVDEMSDTAPLILSQYGFMEIPMPDPTQNLTMCTHCRMVPIQFRAPDSFGVGPISVERIQKHGRTCQRSSLYLTATVDALDEVIRTDFGNDVNVLNTLGFRGAIVEAFGNDAHHTISDIFLDRVCNLVCKKRGIEGIGNIDVDAPLPIVWHLFPMTVEFDAVEKELQELAKAMGHLSFRMDQEYPNFVNFLFMISPGLQPSKKLEGLNTADNVGEIHSD